MRLPKPDDGVAWVTGGSSGIGRALALRLAKAGWTVIISSPHAEALGEAASLDPFKRVHGVAVDVTEETGVARAVGEIEQRFGAIGLAILNAGTYREVTAANFSAADFRAHVEVNIMGVVHCLAALLPRMRQRKLGQIAITGSAAGYRGLYRSSAYGLTKAGLINMAEALAPELEREGICLQICNPGFVATPLTAGNPFPMPQLMTAEAAAEAYYRGLMGGRFEIAFPRRFVFTLKVLRALPYALALPLLRRLGPKGDQP
jgi:NAD(P)-dependent dehydrogenase (short-subunit alcohol dehydrogenase family)